MRPIKDVLIVGGGTAGWLTAAFMARTLGTATEKGIRIRLVESSQIGVIGVGEGTFPSIRGTLAAIGIDEARFLRECGATFKQGIRFNHWVRPAGAAGADHYFHPFSAPSQRPGGPELLPYWLLGAAPAGVAFAQAATLQKAVADAARAPKRDSDGDYLGALNYAYHFDAARFAALLCAHAQSLGVERLLATVEGVALDERGAVSRVHTRELGDLRADLYVDCTGFRAALIGGALGAPWRGLQDQLYVDRAVALQVPYENADAPLASYTIATAQEAGWTWDIGLQERRGVGYVYASRYCDDERAERVLREHIGAAAAPLSARRLELKVGYRPVQWVENCVAIGLSAGFLEPLEASGIGLVESAAYLVSYLFPYNGDLAPAARSFSDFMRGRFERIVDFIKMHYFLTQRRDTPFWSDNAQASGISESLRERLAMWRCRPPHRLDFLTDLEMYPPSSWQYVLYGMEYASDLSDASAAYPRTADARREFETLRQMAAHAAADLPAHRGLVTRMCTRARSVGR